MLAIHDIQELLDLSNQCNSSYEKINELKMLTSFKLENLNDVEFQKTCRFIAQCFNLQSLKLTPNTCLSTLENMSRLQLLCNTICECSKLESLDLTSVRLDNLNVDSLQTISNMVKKCSNLQSLTLAWSPFSCLDLTGMQTICSAIAASPNLQILNLTGSGLDELDIYFFQVLCSSIRKCPRLKTLELSQLDLDHLEPTHFDMLCDAISMSHSLVYCNFHFVQNAMYWERNEKMKEILYKKEILLELAGGKGHSSLTYIAAKVIAESPNLSIQSLPSEIQQKIDRYRSINISLKPIFIESESSHQGLVGFQFENSKKRKAPENNERNKRVNTQELEYLNDQKSNLISNTTQYGNYISQHSSSIKKDEKKKQLKIEIQTESNRAIKLKNELEYLLKNYDLSIKIISLINCPQYRKILIESDKKEVLQAVEEVLDLQHFIKKIRYDSKKLA